MVLEFRRSDMIFLCAKCKVNRFANKKNRWRRDEEGVLAYETRLLLLLFLLIPSASDFFYYVIIMLLGRVKLNGKELIMCEIRRHRHWNCLLHA